MPDAVPDTVRVRLYDVGFGDCFLVEFPRQGRPPFRVLIDCGAHRSGYPRRGWTPEVAVQAVIDDLVADGEAAFLDVVVATHRHQDHVSGFASDLWHDVEVGEVWMPWTEDPDDPDATAVRERQSRLALGLQQAFSRPGAAESLRALAANSLTNEPAMRTLHRGFRGLPARQFLESGTGVPLRPDTCPALSVHVLGPSRDPEVVRDMDPPAGQSYLRFVDAARDGQPIAAADAGQRPFARHFILPPLSGYEVSGHGPTLERKIKDATASAMTDGDFAAAVSLDKAVNGTSLMLMFEFRGAFLLFPGDAQWGTWNAAMRDPAARDLLARTTFYKVGHHGSHNATRCSSWRRCCRRTPGCGEPRRRCIR